jgi:SAM-dependent methyltransferase
VNPHEEEAAAMHDRADAHKHCDEHELPSDAAEERDRSRASPCPVCASTTVSTFLNVRNVPVFCNVLAPTRGEALAAATGDIELALCGNCGHVFNAAFDAAALEDNPAYENSLHFSQHFSKYAEDLAHRLIDAYGIREKDVIDVGCGRGDFLSLVCKAGNNRGYGFDKSYAPDADGSAAPGNLTFIADFYGPQYAGTPCDLLACRHVLEHIEDPVAFIADIRRSLDGKPDAVAFFEVPNAAYTLRDLGIWDLIYEHCAYFSSSSLTRLFSDAGFAVRQVAELYDGQFIGVECVPGGDQPASPGVDPQEVLDWAERFSARYAQKLNHWRGVIDELEKSGRRAVVWGGGSKGVTFLNLLRPSAVVAVVDLNPRKHGRFVPGTGHEVISPARLSGIEPDIVIVMNGVYADEIRQDLKARGLTPDLLVA